MRSRAAALGVLALTALVGARLAQPAQALVTYQPGWNLVGGPEGSYLSGAVGSLYTLQPGDTDYEVFLATSPLHAGWGYWAYFPTGGSLTLGLGQATYSVTPVPGQWLMVGNPGTSGPARILGADVQSVPVLQAGQGGFVLSAGTVTISVPTESLPTVSATPPRPTPPATCPNSGFGQYVAGAGAGCTVTTQTQPTARCFDGSFDYSAAVTACAGHGGVAAWLPNLPGQRTNDSPTVPTPAPTATVVFTNVMGAAPGHMASATVQAPPNAACTLHYTTPAGTASVAQGLGPMTATGGGSATWSWLIDGNTHPGTGTLTVSCTPGGTATAPITIG
jgi:hypothetical protein